MNRGNGNPDGAAVRAAGAQCSASRTDVPLTSSPPITQNHRSSDLFFLISRCIILRTYFLCCSFFSCFFLCVCFSFFVLLFYFYFVCFFLWRGARVNEGDDRAFAMVGGRALFFYVCHQRSLYFHSTQMRCIRSERGMCARS